MVPVFLCKPGWFLEEAECEEPRCDAGYGKGVKELHGFCIQLLALLFPAIPCSPWCIFLWGYLYFIIICQGDATFASAGAEVGYLPVDVWRWESDDPCACSLS